MKFHEFLESHYVTTNIELQAKFSPFKQAETKATQSIIDTQRSFYKFIAYFKILGQFIGIKLHLLPPAKTPEEIQKYFEEKFKKPELKAVENPEPVA